MKDDLKNLEEELQESCWREAELKQQIQEKEGKLQKVEEALDTSRMTLTMAEAQCDILELEVDQTKNELEIHVGKKMMLEDECERCKQEIKSTEVKLIESYKAIKIAKEEYKSKEDTFREIENALEEKCLKAVEDKDILFDEVCMLNNQERELCKGAQHAELELKLITKELAITKEECKNKEAEVLKMGEELTSSYALVSKLQDDCEAKEERLVRVREMVTPRTRDRAGLGLILPPLSTERREKLKKSDDEARPSPLSSARRKRYSIFNFKKCDTEVDRAQAPEEVDQAPEEVDQAPTNLDDKFQNEIDNDDIIPAERCSL